MRKLFFSIAIIFSSLTTFIDADDNITYTLTTIDNQVIHATETKNGLDFHEYRGKAILLSLFGYRCPPCIKEIPMFINLTNKYKDNLTIIAIESQNYPLDKLKEFVEDNEMNYKVIGGIDHGEFISYVSGRAGFSKGIPLPLLISIDKNGDVQDVQAGLVREDELEMIVNDLNE